MNSLILLLYYFYDHLAQYYGAAGFHNMGHLLIAFAHDPNGKFRVSHSNYNIFKHYKMINIFQRNLGICWSNGTCQFCQRLD